MQLYLGDCLEVMKDIPDGSVDMVFADLPYGTTACKWDSVIPLDRLWAEYRRVSKENAAIVLFAGQPFTYQLYASQPELFKYGYIWVKNNSTGAFNANKMPMRAHESILVFYEAQPTYNPQKIKRTDNELKRLSRNSTAFAGTELYGGKGTRHQCRDRETEKNPDDVLHFNSVHGRDSDKVAHPTQKPVALLEYLIRTYTNEGETVLDNTMGSGSTGVACANTGRKFIGIEKEPKYFEIAQSRIYNSFPPVVKQVKLKGTTQDG